MIPVQATLFAIRSALQAASSALRVSLGTNIVPVIDVAEALSVDSGIATFPEGRNRYQRTHIVTGAVAGHAQLRLYNPRQGEIGAGSGASIDRARIVYVDAITYSNPTAAALQFTLDAPTPAAAAPNFFAELFALPVEATVGIGSYPRISQAELYTDTDAYAPNVIFQRVMVPAGDSRRFEYRRPMVIMPGGSVQASVATVNVQMQVTFEIRELWMP